MTTSLLQVDSEIEKRQPQLLVVDDEAQCADLLATVLRGEGYAVREAHSGADALALMRETPADLVITDLIMPTMNGVQLLARIKELYTDTDVVVMTGFGTIEDALEAVRRGASDFLPKPFQPHDLKRVAASCLRARRANSQQAFLTQSSSMLELARLLAQTPDPHVLPSRAVEIACRNFDADSAILFAYDASRQSFALMAHKDTDSAWDKAESAHERAAEAIRRKRPVLSADADSSDCYLYLPLKLGDAPRGVLCLRRKGGPWFHEKTVEDGGTRRSLRRLSCPVARLREALRDR